MTDDPKPRSKGRPFAKGADDRRNPGGRPKMPAEVREAALGHSMKAIETLARLMENRKAPTVALAAATALLDRAIGRPETTAALTGADGKPLFPQERAMSDVDLARHLAFILASAKHQIDKQAAQSNPSNDSLPGDSTHEH